MNMAPESDLRSDNSSVVLTKDNTNFTQEAPLPDKLSTAASAQLSASREDCDCHLTKTTPESEGIEQRFQADCVICRNDIVSHLPVPTATDRVPTDKDDVGGTVSEASASSSDSDVRAHKEFLRITASRKFLSEQKKKAPKRLKQYAEYMHMIEARMDCLEKDFAVLSKKPVEKPEEIKEKQPHAAIPQLKLMSINEYMVNGGHQVPASHYAIDVLLDSIEHGTQHSAKQIALTGGSGIDNHYSELVQRMTRGARDLPERIRINSRPVQNILDSVTNPNTKTTLSLDYPLVILRPFKVLIYHEDRIRNHLAELDSKFGTTVHRASSVSTNKTANDHHDLKTASDHVPSSTTSTGLEARNLIIWTTEALLDLRCLIQFIDQFLKPVIQSLPLRSRIRFSELWYLFSPGQVVYVKDKDHPQKLWRIVQTTGGRRYLTPIDTTGEATSSRSRHSEYSDFVMDCYYIDYDGVRFGPSYHQFKISFSSLDDITPINSLPLIPLSVAETNGQVDVEVLKKRGEVYVDCTKVCHRYYSGRSLVRKSNGDFLRHIAEHPSGRDSRVFSESIESEVMIDIDRALQSNPEWHPDLGELEPQKVNSRELLASGLIEEHVEGDARWDILRKNDFFKEELQMQNWFNSKGVAPSGNDLLLLPDRVFGFVFRSRKWACLSLSLDGTGKSHLRMVEDKKDAWTDLELPQGHKEIVQSLIDKHFNKHKSGVGRFDLIADKGKGLILLLHGAPGVGKTSTAECVALSNSKPLLSITCGDLGLTPREVEGRLESTFQMAQAWDCVLLLDEADIFLAQRSNTDLERNALVSVFLRVLEYYEGILFLTTNRVGVVDEAFKSRIHMPLYYPWLNKVQTRKIWRSQLRRIKEMPENPIEADESEIIDYAEDLFAESTGLKGNGPRWNGRQIRNAFQSALAIAEYDIRGGKATKLEVSHFKKVAEASNEFDEYLRRTKNGFTDADIAVNEQMRTDTYGLEVKQSNLAQQQFHPEYNSTPQVPLRSRSRTPNNLSYMPQNMQMGPTSQAQGYSILDPSSVQHSALQYQSTQPGAQSYSVSQQQPNTMRSGYTPRQQNTGYSQHNSMHQIPAQGLQQSTYALPQQPGNSFAQMGDQVPQSQPLTPEQQYQIGGFHQQQQAPPPQQSIQGHQGSDLQLQQSK